MGRSKMSVEQMAADIEQPLLVIVPYRDRESHLKQFIPYITSTLTNQNIPHKIVVVEQLDNNLFNRGLLANIGFYIYKNYPEYICIHDVDIIGENFDYTYEAYVTHLSARNKTNNYKEYYSRCLGGVTLFPKKDFISVNGFSNKYSGWGCEDDDLRLRCDIMNIKVKRKQGKFYTLHHQQVNNPQYSKNHKRLTHFEQLPQPIQKKFLLNDGLNNVDKYFVLNKVIEKSNYTIAKVYINL